MLTVTFAGPLTTLQDAGRFGMLRHGISASGPMDAESFAMAGAALPVAGGTAIELTQSLSFDVDAGMNVSAAGGQFQLRHNGAHAGWPDTLVLRAGDHVDVTPGAAGNYGYLRFNREIDVAPVLGSRSTNLTVGLGGFAGRSLRPGDRVGFGADGVVVPSPTTVPREGAIRVTWGLHADPFDREVRRRFTETEFTVSANLDRMGVRLVDAEALFRAQRQLSLVSDAIVPGDIQILGDGTPIVLMRDHQPTGGYPRIATVVSADLSRFAQMRPGSAVRFAAVTLEHAR